MFRNIFKYLPAAFAALALSSCISDRAEGCDVWLEFIYDHNMEYTDAFSAQVGAVDIYVFSGEGDFLFSRHGETGAGLTGGNKMLLGGGLGPGTYRIVTLGRLINGFSVSDRSGRVLTEGVTSIDDFRISLDRTSTDVFSDFPHLWLGEPVEINNRHDGSVWRLPLKKMTNTFHLVLKRTGGNESRADAAPDYAFRITTPEGAVYDCNGAPKSGENVAYAPYSLEIPEEDATVALGHIHTMRLFCDSEYSYRLIVRNNSTGAELWNYDLMKLLAYIKPDSRPDGTDLPMQEFLDRESEWNIVILYSGGEPGPGADGGFTAVGVEVNGWIFWLNDIDL